MKRKHTNIHVERARYDISQKELAEKVGTTKQTISNIENGKVIPGVVLALKISKFFSISVENLFKLE